MPDTVLVTGGTGFAGSHLLDTLAGGGLQLAAWRRSGPPLAADGRGIRWQTVDLLDAAGVRAAIAGLQPSMIYHCAGAAHVGDSWHTSAATLRVNVLGTHHLLEAVRVAGLRPRLLIPSSAMVYDVADEAIPETAALVPRSPYALSKLAQEMVGRHGLSDGVPAASIARSFNHLGPRQDPSFVASSFARQIARIEAGLAPPVLKVGNLDAERDFTDVRDTVQAYRAILERGQPGRVYNVCSGRLLKVRVLLDRLLARTTAVVRVEQDPDRQRPHDQPRLFGDNTRIRTELQWSPRIDLDRTIDDLLEYWRARVRREP